MENLKSINFPCVMLEKIEGAHVTVKSLTKFILVNSQADIDKKAKFFINPVICHYYAIVNEAKRIASLI
ncbi:MAG TPA: hypothetical protein VN698_00015 [Bacteroidia bacterium]|nr:hypothetical protein [Bacteroidia bacterium]